MSGSGKRQKKTTTAFSRLPFFSPFRFFKGRETPQSVFSVPFFFSTDHSHRRMYRFRSNYGFLSSLAPPLVGLSVLHFLTL